MYDKYKQVAERAAREAGAIQIEGLGKPRTIDYKSAYNLVTDIDKACEAKIISIIRAKFPDDDILAEEGGGGTDGTAGGNGAARDEGRESAAAGESGADENADVAGGRRRWIIDPLDGTTNYAHRYPFFAVSIAVEEHGKIVAGVVYNAVNDELFHAQVGGGAYLTNSRTGVEPLRLKVSDTAALENSLLATGFPYDTAKATDDNMLRFSTLTDQCHGVRRDGAAALDLCFVAAGQLDGFWETGLSPWDMAAGGLIVTESGGMISDLSGEEFDLQSGRMMADNGHIHDELVFVLKRLDTRVQQLS